MDRRAFQPLLKRVPGGIGSRRAVLKTVASSTLCVALDRLGLAETAARRRCKANWKTCDRAGGPPCCAGSTACCLPYTPYGETGKSSYCVPEGYVCCTAEAGGGSCGPDHICCPQTPRYPGVNDYCEKVGGECCNDAVGGSCGPGLTCCVDPSVTPQYTCCPKTVTVRGEGRGQTSQPRNFHRRHGE